jgi:hypothetical protein
METMHVLKQVADLAVTENNGQAALLAGPLEIQGFKLTPQKFSIQVDQRVQCSALRSRRAVPIITEKTQKLIYVCLAQRFRMLILMKPNESFYPMDVGFLCLVGITLIAKISTKPVHKAL